MAISIEKQFGVHQHALQLRAERAEILASNIANADTPGYKARDMDFQGLLQDRMNLSQEQAAQNKPHPSHLFTTGQDQMNSALLYRNPQQPAIDGNTVDAQIEKTELVTNNMGYQAAFQFLNGRIRSMLTAIKGE